MKVHVSFTSWFKRFTGVSEEIEIELAEGSTLLQAVLAVGIPAEEVGFITVNNVKADETYALTNGDEIRIYPLIIGG